MTENIWSILNEFGSVPCQLTKMTPVKFIIVCVFTHLAVGLYMSDTIEEYLHTTFNPFSAKGYGIGAVAALICFVIFAIMSAMGSLCK